MNQPITKSKTEKGISTKMGFLKSNLKPAEASPVGNRYCTNCSLTRNSIGGYWKLYDGGNKRRWICKSCGDLPHKSSS